MQIATSNGNGGSSHTATAAATNPAVTFQTLYESERQKTLLLSVVSIALGVLFVLASIFAIAARAQRPSPFIGGALNERLKDDGGPLGGGAGGPGGFGGDALREKAGQIRNLRDGGPASGPGPGGQTSAPKPGLNGAPDSGQLQKPKPPTNPQ